MSFGKFSFRHFGILLSGVSILVLMDVVREDPYLYKDVANIGRFNPCSNGCRSGSLRKVFNYATNFTVSILVLMDVVREAVRRSISALSLVGFNPCSNGCRSGR